MNWYKIGKFQTFDTFQYSAHSQEQNTVQNAKNVDKYGNI